MGSIFGSKPSDAHVIWRTGRDDSGRKRFDFEYLELWAAHFGADYEEWDRVDHERAAESRHQCVCVFARTTDDGAEVSLGGESWHMGAVEKPRTFIEIDETGLIRLQGWSTGWILDVDELVIDGATLKLRTADGETKSVNTQKLRTRP